MPYVRYLSTVHPSFIFIWFQGTEMEDTPKEEDKLSDGAFENAPPKKQETREEMLSRHRYFLSLSQNRLSW